MPARRIEKRRITALKPHPRQREFFRMPSDVELTELADDIDKNGLRNHPHIDSDNTILMGHRRIEACKVLGWEEIEVVVRYDLGGDDARAMCEFVSDNLYSQQLDPIGIAKSYEELRALEGRLGGHHQDDQNPGELRDRIAAKMPVKMSGRQLDRLRRLLKLPLPVQNAIREGLLRANHGDAILGRSHDTQQEIAKALAEGEVPERIIQRFGLKNLTARRAPDKSLKSLLEALSKELPALQDNLHAVDSVRLRNNRNILEVLEGAAELFVKLRDRQRARSAESATDPTQFTKVGFRPLPDNLAD